MNRTFRSLPVLAVFLLCLSPSGMGQSRAPLPDAGEVLAGVRTRLGGQYNEEDALKGYVYRVDVARHELDGNDAIETTETTETEVYYFDHGPFRKLLAENGAGLSEDAAGEQEEEFHRHVRGAVTQDFDRRPWLYSMGDGAEDRDKAIADVVNGFEFTIIGRELVEGRPAIVIEFIPREDAEYESRVGEMVLSNVVGHAWVDEADLSLVRIDAEIVDAITVGPFGSLARISEGTEYVREWRKVNDEVWLPSRLSMTIEARALLLRKTHRKIEEQYSDYRRFHVDTEFEIQFED